jgi:threonylcarbamoyladenosine tRNA methylthiotransferase MtaB
LSLFFNTCYPFPSEEKQKGTRVSFRFYIYTFGCRCNQADSAAIRQDLLHHSMTETETHQDADIIVVNTCTVTHKSDQQVRQTVRRFHRDNPAADIIVTGCYAERSPDALASIEGVSFVIGNVEKERLADIICQCKSRERLQPSIIHTPIASAAVCKIHSMAETGGKTRPVLKIQDGCNSRCSYCIVPSVRGPSRSALAEDVLAEVKALIRNGFQEIVLTGVHLGSFGREPGSRTSLFELLRRIVELPGLCRIRLSSIEPMQFDRDIVRLAAENPAFAHHFHIPVQSGSDRILRKMHRPYIAAQFLDLVKYIRSEIPDAGIGADILTGFPGETEEDFAITCELLQNSPLTYLHVFPFSPREGTAAYSFPDRVPSKIVKQRLTQLLDLSRDKNLNFRRQFLGRKLSAITLSKDENMGDSVVLTGNYIHAHVSGLAEPPNVLVAIRIDEVQPAATYASIAN